MKRMKSAWGIFITSAMTHFIFPLSIESLCNMACVAGRISGRCCSFKKVPWAEQFSQLHIAQCKGLPTAESGTLLAARKLPGALWWWRACSQARENFARGIRHPGIWTLSFAEVQRSHGARECGRKLFGKRRWRIFQFSRRHSLCAAEI